MADKAGKGSDKQEQQKPKRARASVVHAADMAGSRVAGIVQRLSLGRAAITPADFVALNRTVGMRRAMRLIDTAASTSHETVDRSGHTSVLRNPGHSLQSSLGRRAITIQPKLTVGAANDAYEQEADTIAERVMRMPRVPDTPAVQGLTPMRADIEPVQTTRVSATDAFDAGADFEQHLGTAGGGAPLPARTRAFMEPRFGADFSKVRVHSGSSATILNRAISAQAFTHGSDIYLASGKNNLDSTVGKRLLAHELTHTIQQGAAPLQRQQIHRTFNHSTLSIIQRTGDEAKIEEVDEDESPRKWEPPKEIEQPAVPLMLADAPWSEVEAREGRERKERSQVEDPRYQNKLKDIGGTRSTGSMKLSQQTLGGANQMLKEQFQQRDPRYQNKLGEIGGTRSTSGTKLSQQTIGDSNQMLKEQFQQRDPRYQNKLAEITPKAPGTIGDLTGDQKNQLSDARSHDSAKQDWRRQQKAETEAAKLEAESSTLSSQVLFTALEPTEQEEAKKDEEYVLHLSEWKKAAKDSLAFWQAKTRLAQFLSKWINIRNRRKNLLNHLKPRIAATSVPGRNKAAFIKQGEALLKGLSKKILSAKHDQVESVIDEFNSGLAALALEHKKVDDFDKRVGAKYGGLSIDEVMALVDAAISNVGFDPVKDGAVLDEKITSVEEAIGRLTKNEKRNMEETQSAENKLTSHSMEGHDPRGEVEEKAAIKEIQKQFKELQTLIKGRDKPIQTGEKDTIRNAASKLDSFNDTVKEKKAHDLKVKYEATPYFLYGDTSKAVHAQRHIKGISGYKTALEIEKDYKSEVDNQYKVKIGVWCKYLGYTKTGDNSKITPSDAGYGGVGGHNSLFLAFTSTIMAKDKAASDPTSAYHTADALLNSLYPSNGTGGAHYTLERPKPSPHAYRGGPTIPGSYYQSDKVADNETWQNASTFMEGRQVAEQARVRGLIVAALADHMRCVKKLDPDIRK